MKIEDLMEILQKRNKEEYVMFNLTTYITEEDSCDNLKEIVHNQINIDNIKIIEKREEGTGNPEHYIEVNLYYYLGEEEVKD